MSKSIATSQRRPALRSYPRNSPEAAGRILALVLIADGHACGSEFDLLRQLSAERELGLEPQLLPHIVYTLSEELLSVVSPPGSFTARLDEVELASLMAEITDPTLQCKVLRLALAAARADGHLTGDENAVLEAAQRHWMLASGGAPNAKKVATRVN